MNLIINPFISITLIMNESHHQSFQFIVSSLLPDDESEMKGRRDRALRAILIVALFCGLAAVCVEGKAPVWCSKLYNPLYPLPFNTSTSTRATEMGIGAGLGREMEMEMVSAMELSLRPPLSMPILQVLPDVQPYTWETTASLLVTVNQTQALGLSAVGLTCWLLSPTNGTKREHTPSSSSSLNPLLLPL